MIQCKIFKGHDTSIVEQQVNTWLESQHSNFERIEIHSIKQSSAMSGTIMTTVITIFYERVKK